MRCGLGGSGSESESLALLGGSMAPLNEIVSRLLESTPKATVDHTLHLLGLSSPAIPADPSATESRKQALEKKLDHLVRQFLVLTQHKSNIKEAAGKLETEARRVQDELEESERPGVSPDALVRFVNVLEEANQYFDFQISAKQAHDFKHARSADEISHTLLLDKSLCSDFPKLGKAQINNAAHAIFWELYNQLHRKNKTKKEEDPALFDWIYNLAFQARKHGYAVDEDPIVELEKIMETEPYVYENYFLTRRLQVEYTEKSTQEARDKYSELVSIMIAKYKEISHDKYKFTSTATSAGKRDEQLTSTATTARDKETFDKRYAFTSAVTQAGNKNAFNEKCTSNATTVMDTKSKRPFVMTGDKHMEPEKRKRLFTHH